MAFAFALFCASVQAQSQNLFYQAPTYPGLDPTVTADFNGDGKPDLASADGTVMLGNGDGTFKTVAPWKSTSTQAAGFIAVGDFNGDGKADLLVTYNNVCCNLYVVLGNGDGTFQAPMATNVGTNLFSLVAVDLNGDGKMDVVGMAATGLFVFLAKGDGTFAPGAMYPSISGNVMVAGDFNGDGKADVAIGIGVLSIEVLPGNGDGTFQPGINNPVGTMNARTITAGT
jgi:hypothetical protein